MAVVANGLLILRAGWTSGEASLTFAAFALLLAAGAAILYGAWRRRHLLNGRGTTAPPAIAIAVAAIVTLIGCAAGIASVILR